MKRSQSTTAPPACTSPTAPLPRPPPRAPSSIFSTLATWTVAFSVLAFSLIDRRLSDPLFYPGLQYPDLDTITSSLAALLVAFPLCLLISRAISRQIAAHPEKRESPVRKWLTYLALVIAACVFMGDLITALSYLLRGELTSIFVAKSVIVLALSGGIFGFYFGGLRKPFVAAHHGRIAALASAAVALLAFLNLGSPQRQRDLRADSERARELSTVSSQVDHPSGHHCFTLEATTEPGFSNLAPATDRQPADPATPEPHP